MEESYMTNNNFMTLRRYTVVVFLSVAILLDMQLTIMGFRLRTDIEQLDRRVVGTMNRLRAVMSNLNGRDTTVSQSNRQTRFVRVQRSKGPVERDSEWKVVGLMSDPRWEHIGQLQQECSNALKSSKAFCIILQPDDSRVELVDVVIAMAENENLAYVAHNLKTQALFVELLPWVSPGLEFGRDAPTSFGMLLHESSVNHVGLPLSTESLPTCEENSSSAGCINQQQIKHQLRSFRIKADLIAESTGPFLRENTSGGLCRHYEQQLSGIILYNIFCRQYLDQSIQPHHFFWQNDTAESDDDSTIAET
jgi:hypothetical protein